MSEPLPPDHPFSVATEEEKDDATPAKGGKDGHLAIVSLSGLGLTESGKLKKSKYFNILTNTMDDYSDMVFTKEEALKIHAHVRALKHGSAASIPIICAGEACIWASRCPYLAIGKAPLGRGCIWELNLMKQWQLNYLEEYDVDPDNFTEMTLVNELVEIELQVHRCNLYLSSHPEESVGIVDQMVAVDKQGNVITQKQISQHFELREKLLTRKHRLIKYLVGDRQEKYKKEAALKTREVRDPSSSMAQLKQQMEDLQRKLSAADVLVEGRIVSGTLTNGEKVPGNHEKTPAREVAPAALYPDDIQADDNG